MMADFTVGSSSGPSRKYASPAIAKANSQAATKAIADETFTSVVVGSTFFAAGSEILSCWAGGGSCFLGVASSSAGKYGSRLRTTAGHSGTHIAVGMGGESSSTAVEGGAAIRVASDSFALPCVANFGA